MQLSNYESDFKELFEMTDELWISIVVVTLYCFALIHTAHQILFEMFNGNQYL